MSRRLPRVTHAYGGRDVVCGCSVCAARDAAAAEAAEAACPGWQRALAAPPPKEER